MNPVYEDYLAHYGVKGQKHGVRRYQNEDGTYTAEGKARYFDSNGGSRNNGTAQKPALRDRVKKGLKRLGKAAAVAGGAYIVGHTIGNLVGQSMGKRKYSMPQSSRSRSVGKMALPRAINYDPGRARADAAQKAWNEMVRRKRASRR